MKVIDRFNEIYIHDSSILHLGLSLNVEAESLVLDLDRAGIAKDGKELDYELYYNPATIKFIDVKRIGFPEGYYLECEILQSEARASELDGYVCFSFMLSGGWNTEVWARPMEIVARDFVLGGNRVDYQAAMRQGRPGER